MVYANLLGYILPRNYFLTKRVLAQVTEQYLAVASLFLSTLVCVPQALQLKVKT